MPQVVAGFEPDDILLGLLMLVQQIREGKARVDNAYPRAVNEEGNPKALSLMNMVFEPSDTEWRGFPVIPRSGLKLREEFSGYDAQKKFGIEIKPTKKQAGCICDRITGVSPLLLIVNF